MTSHSQDAEMLARVEEDADRILAATGPRSEVARVLTALEGAKKDVDQEVAELLEAVASLVKRTGATAPVLAFAAGILREALRMVALQHGIRLCESTQEAVASGILTETLVIWGVGGTAIAVVPRGQNPAETLNQLRAAIAEREDEQQTAAAFQASAAAQAAR
ncbi:hypothetical protein ACWEQ7_22170 [Streptomyces sp. NPDC004069]